MTDASTTTQLPSDAELITSARAGDDGAFAELFRRHETAARAAGRSLSRSKADVDDLVAEAFTRVLQALRAGRGPEVAFRPYLLTCVRNAFYDRTRKDKRLEFTDEPEDMPNVSLLDMQASGEDRALIVQAYASLPERWQLALWHTEVEGRSAAEVGLLLGIAPNAVAALTYRAREGLRQAYLQAHLQRQTPEACQSCRPNLGAYVRDGLATRDRRKVDEHLEHCQQCRDLVVELQETNNHLRLVLIPLVIGVPAAKYLGLLAGGKGLVGLLRRSPRSSQVAAGVAAAAAVVAVAVGAAAVTGRPPSDAAAATSTVAVASVVLTVPSAGGGGTTPPPPAATSALAPDETPAPAIVLPTSPAVSQPVPPSVQIQPVAVVPQNTVLVAPVVPVTAARVPRPTVAVATTPTPTVASTATSATSTSTTTTTTTTTPASSTSSTTSTSTTSTTSTTTTTTTTAATTTVAPPLAEPNLELSVDIDGPFISGQYGYLRLKLRNRPGAAAAVAGVARGASPSGPAVNPTVNIDFPSAVTFVSATGWTCEPVTTGARCAVPDLRPGDSSETMVELSLAPDVPPDITVVARAASRGSSRTAEQPQPITVTPAGTTSFARLMPGGVAVTGNTVMTCLDDDQCAEARQGHAAGVKNTRHVHQMGYTDVDADAATFNSSMATLAVPTGSTVEYALLVWSGDTAAGGGGLPAPDPSARDAVRFGTPSGWAPLTADRVRAPGVGSTAYYASVDVTDLIAGSGEYGVADVQTGTGRGVSGGRGRFGGWSLIVAYRDSNSPRSLVAVLDQYSTIDSAGELVTFPLALPIHTGSRRAAVALLSCEGDRGLGGEVVTGNGLTLGNTDNPIGDVFNSTIDGGRQTAPGDPNTFGIDADVFALDIASDASSLELSMTSPNDLIRLGAVGIVVPV